jgi:hypothetical protein
VAPHFNYCSSILFLANEGQFQDMQKIQNKMMRIILRCPNDTRITNMLSTLCWVSIKQRVYFNTLLMLFRIEKGDLPEYLSINLVRVRDSHSITTRSGDNFVLPIFTKAISQNSLFYKGVKSYNDLTTYNKQSGMKTITINQLL